MQDMPSSQFDPEESHPMEEQQQESNQTGVNESDQLEQCSDGSCHEESTAAGQEEQQEACSPSCNIEEACTPSASDQRVEPSVSAYQHRTGNRAYLEAAVMPQLQDALLALLKRVEQDKLELAKGSAWEQDEEGGPFRPPDWRPFSAMRWLADYLLAHNAQSNAPNSTEQQ